MYTCPFFCLQGGQGEVFKACAKDSRGNIHELAVKLEVPQPGVNVRGDLIQEVTPQSCFENPEDEVDLRRMGADASTLLQALGISSIAAVILFQCHLERALPATQPGKYAALLLQSLRLHALRFDKLEFPCPCFEESNSLRTFKICRGSTWRPAKLFLVFLFVFITP